MKMIAFVSVAALALATGCSQEGGQSTAQTNTASSGGSFVTAPVDYLNTATKQQHSAVKKIDVTVINQAIQLFQVQEGRYPKDLNELVEKNYMKQIPATPHGSSLDYDAEAGTVKVVSP
jgi:hypothetical protein